MSHSRKHLTSATLNEFPVPAEGEQICRVLRLMGNNNLEVQGAQGEKLVVVIPQKFNKVVWIGKGMHNRY
jgi:translation initiation factor IF-1